MVFQEGDPPPFYSPGASAYVGKPKGLRQVLYERGLIDVGTPEQQKDLPKVDQLREIMANCYDFQHEETALEQAMHKQGHLLRMTPKGHPELAGVGIEYSWGKSKMLFRKHNDCNPKTFHTQVLTAMAREVLFLDRVRKFARRARDYMRCYDQGASKHVSVENMRKKFKTHRCATDTDWGFIRNS